MIDIRQLREDPQPAKESLVARGEDPARIDEVLAADARRLKKQQDFEAMRADQKALSKSIGQAAPEERAAVLAQAKELAGKVKEAEAEAGAASEEAQQLLAALPNIIIPGIPSGGEDDYEVLAHRGPQIRDFAAEGIKVRDHLEIGEMLQAIDVKRGAKVSGSRLLAGDRSPPGTGVAYLRLGFGGTARIYSHDHPHHGHPGHYAGNRILN